MADNRPYRPLAANIQVMHRTCFVQARVRGVGILLNFVAENNRSDNLGQLSPARKIRTSLTRKRHLLRLSLAENDPGEPSRYPRKQPGFSGIDGFAGETVALQKVLKAGLAGARSWRWLARAERIRGFQAPSHSPQKYADQEPAGRRCQINSMI